MNPNKPDLNRNDLNRQQQQWETVFSCNEYVFGEKPSSQALWAFQLFKHEGK